MIATLPVRSAPRNETRRVASPSFTVVASRVLDDDRLMVALRGEFSGSLAGAQRHARRLARAVADRFGVRACADVFDASNLPVYSVTSAEVAL